MYRLHVETDLDDYSYNGDEVDILFIDLLVNHLDGKIQTRLQSLC